jgi:hypothetical protein
MPPASDETVEARMDIVRDLATTSVGLDFTLEKTLSAGIAFHHAGGYLVASIQSALTKWTDAWSSFRIDNRREGLDRRWV